MKKGTFRFDIEQKTLEAMISIFCRKQHQHKDGLCDECRQLQNYALLKLEKCKFGAKKPNCSHCPVHCYEPARRDQIQKVMRHSGPLMLRYHPLLAMIHIAKRIGKKPPVKKP